MNLQEHQELVEVALAHTVAEAAGDLEATLATLDDDPVYELQPIGRAMRGSDKARRFYEHFFANFKPLVEGRELRSQWVTDDGVGQEYTLWLRLPDGSTERHDIIGVLTFGENAKLSGERVYTSDLLLSRMFGPLLDEAEPVASGQDSSRV
ncbi:nuclear transport factor 2 family protein [Rhodococcus sp. ARC_M6]|uniref:nuclear transport factor 2 family protein n=1 Tax=Rhodococcus sp. ARC_M6 TaxID=2928852 RepID=UPI001FB53BA6|nr:nuclear transport factor 2 family protein [Rhodococcus sp. ARC_M6]MCJ0902447.1 nuclear transport factor 2 family protein [Rhodococcus sp. ARC_M6]